MTISRYENTLLLLAVLIASPFLLSRTALSYANISVEPQSDTVYQGQPLTLVIKARGGEPVKGVFFYRPAGGRYYQRLSVNFKRDGATAVTIPATAVVTPGIEYYIQVTDASGKITGSPLTEAAGSPDTLKVLETYPPPDMTLLSPDPGIPFAGEALSIVIEISSPGISLTDGTITLLLDDTDVTALATFSDGRITFSPPFLPGPGRHILNISATDPAGSTHEKSWSFEVADKGEGENTREVYARGGLSFNYGRQIKSPDVSTGDTMSSNLNLEFGMTGEDWEVTWSGVNIQYIKDNPGDNFTINSGFNFTMRKGNQFLEYGDITINEPSLASPSFARRGFHAKLKGLRTELHLFNVSTDTVSGWNSGIGDTDRQVYGLSIKRPMLSNGGLPLTLVYITGENQAVSGFNTAGTQNLSKGDILGFTLSHTLYGVKVDGEVAGSRYDSDTTDNTGDKQDIAGTANLSTALGRYSLGMSYYYYGPNFSSIANPNFTADRKSISGNMNTSYGHSTLSLSLNRERDNVKGDSSRPVVYSTSGTVTYGLAVASLPTLNASYSHSMQESRKEPAGSNEVKNTNDTLNISLAKSGKKWNVNLRGNYGLLNDRVGSLDSETRGIHLSGNYTPLRGLTLSPSASLAESESSGVVNKTSIASLTAGIPLDRYVNTSFQVSYTLSDTSDGSQDLTNLNGSWRLSVNLRDFIKNRIDYGAQTLALTANYSRLDDKVNPSGSGDDISVFLSINFFAPLDWTRGF